MRAAGSPEIMLEQSKIADISFNDGADWRALEEQLGSPDEAATRSASVFAGALSGLRTADELRAFVTAFEGKTLANDELPIILRAYNHAIRNELRELIALDNSLENTFPNEALASASQRVGRNQLRRMRSLKTERFITRYWDAVHARKATGWHAIVYGIVLAIYSIPLRQGLIHYSQQTITGFLEAGAAALRLPHAALMEIETPLLAKIPAIVETALAGESAGGLRCV